jgi:hypothetical protein
MIKSGIKQDNSQNWIIKNLMIMSLYFYPFFFFVNNKIKIKILSKFKLSYSLNHIWIRKYLGLFAIALKYFCL